MNSISDIERAGETIGAFYDAAMGDKTWPEALQAACRFLNCHAATLNSHDPYERKSRVEGGEYNTDPEFTRTFNETYGGLSPFALFAMLIPEGSPRRTDLLIPRDEFVASRFYKEWCAPQGYKEFMGCVLIREARALYAIGFVRTDEQPPLTEDDVRLLDVIVPHVTRAVRIARVFGSMEEKQENLLGTLDSVPEPVISLEHDLKIVTINKAGVDLIDQGDIIRLRHGRLMICDPAKQAGLEAAFLSKEVAPATFQLSSKPPLVAHLVPYAGAQINKARAVLMIHGQNPSQPAPGALLQLTFGITTAEMRVLALMMQGGTRETIARDLGISLATVKTHLQGLFAKTDTKRQADLMRKVMGG